MGNTFIEIVKSEIEKFNPYHDQLGRFTTAGGATSFTYRPGASVAHDNAIAREKARHAASGGGTGTDTPPNNQRPRKGLESGLGQTHAQAIEDIAKKAPENIRKVWDKYGDEIEVADANWKRTANCNSAGQIKVNIQQHSQDTRLHNPYEVVMHESGHSIDQAIYRKFGSRFSTDYKNGLFEKTIKDEVDKYTKQKQTELKNNKEWMAANSQYRSQVGRNGKVTVGAARNEIGKELRKGTYKTTGDVSDIFEGATEAKITGSAGHGKGYWVRRDYFGTVRRSVAVEAFAEMFSATTTNPESLKNIQKYFPESYKVFNEMMDYASTL